MAENDNQHPWHDDRAGGDNAIHISTKYGKDTPLKEENSPMNFGKIVLLSALTFFMASTITAQTGIISGSVRDQKTNATLPGANIRVLGTYLGSATGKDGTFSIQSLKYGEYVLQVSFIGYKTRQIAFAVREAQPPELHIHLEHEALLFDEVVVTANKQAEKRDRVTTSISTLHSEKALQRNAIRLDAALASIPGVSVLGENVNIRNSSGLTRGMGSRVLVLNDGIPILMSDFGNMNWGLFSMTDIERVEVLKGPASAIYGSYALGGVINFITRQPTTQGKLSIRTSAGIYDKPLYPEWEWTKQTLHFNRTDVSYSRQFKSVGLRVSAAHHTSTGDRVNRNFKRWNGTARINWVISNTSLLTVFGSYASDRRGEFVWSRLDNPYLVEPEFEDYAVSLDAFSFYAKYMKKVSDKIEIKSRISLLRQISGNQFRVEGDFKPAQGPGAHLELHVTPDSSMQMIAGLELRYDFAEQRHFGRHSAITTSPFLHSSWDPLSWLRVTLGLRFDRYNLLPSDSIQAQFKNLVPFANPLPDGATESHLSPQVGFSIKPTNSTVVHGSYGAGIRIPSIAERFVSFKIPFEFLGNANLETEKSTSLELGLRQRVTSAATLELAFFKNRYKKLIEPAYVADLTRFYATLINIKDAEIKGVEASGRIALWKNRIQLQASGTWTEPVIKDPGTYASLKLPFTSGDYLSYRPRVIGFLSGSVNPGCFSLGADFTYASALEKEQIQMFRDDERVARKILDIRAGVRHRNLSLIFYIKNLLQYHVSQVERNMNETRNFSFSLSLNH